MLVTYATYEWVYVERQPRPSTPIRRVRRLGASECPSAGITLPRDDLGDDGGIDDSGEVVGE